MQTGEHIVIFSAYYPPHLGGVELFTKNLSQALVELGYRVTVVTSSLDIPSTPAEHQEPSNIELATIPSKSFMNDRFPLIIPRRSMRSSIQALLDSDIDRVVINTRYYPLTLLGCSVARKRGIKPLIIDHSSGPLSDERSAAGIILRMYERLMNAIVKRYSPVICSVSDKGSEWLRRLGFKPIGIIHNAVSVEEFRDMASSRTWRKELGCGPDTMLVVSAGRLIPEKGVLKAIDATNIVAGTGMDIRLAIAGDGALRQEVESRQNKNIVYVGKLSPTDMSALLRDADCLCFPTDYPEGLPTILLESAAQETAIITSNCAGAREVIPGTDYGIVLENNTVEELSKALLFFYENKPIRISCGKEARKCVEEHFSWQASALSLIRLLETE